MKKTLRTQKLTKAVLCSVLAASVLGVCGSAVAATHNEKWVVTDQVIENKVTSDGYNMEDLRSGAEITGSVFRNNKFTGSEVYGGVFRVMNTKDPKQFVIVRNSRFDGNISTATGSGTWALGGAVMLKGTTTTFEDVDFDNNKIVGEQTIAQVGGGAVYADAVRNSDVVKPDGNADVVFKVTKDMSYTGNDVTSGDSGNTWYDTFGGLAQSKGGFLFIDRDAIVKFDVASGVVLSIGDDNSIGNMDTIASVRPKDGTDVDYAVINKTGEGTMVVNTSLNDYYGIVNVEAGTLKVNKHWNVQNTINLKTGTIDANELKLLKLDNKINSYDSSNTATKDYLAKDNIGTIITAEGSTLNTKTIVVNAGKIDAAGVVNVDGGIDIVEGTSISVALNGGGKISEGVYVDGNNTFTANNIDVIGEVAADNGAAITLTGGSVTAAVGEDGETDFGTEGGKISAKGVEIKSSISASNGGIFTVTDSNITTNDGLWVANGGKLTLEGNGTYKLGTENGHLTVADESSEINLYGGTLVADNLRDLTKESVDKGIILNKDGVIETKSGQIFANSIAVDGLTKDSGEVTNNAIDYQGGTLKFTDTKYTLEYVAKANENLDAKGATSIVMTGDVIGAVDNKVSVDEVASVTGDNAGTNVALDKVTAEADKNLIVGIANAPTDAVENIQIEDAVATGFAVGTLNMTAGSTGVVITNNQEVTLGGTAGGTIVTVDGKDEEVKIVVGTTDKVDGAVTTSGTLNIGNKLVNETTNALTVKGEVVVNKESELNVRGNTEVTKELTVKGGTVNITNGSLTTTVVAENDSLINVGDNSAAGMLKSTDTKLNGSKLLLDPAWKDGASIETASKAGIEFASDAGGVDGLLTIGQNSVLSEGTTDTSKAEAAFAKSGLTWGKDGITAALYIEKNMNLASNGGIKVDGTITKDNVATGGYAETGKVEFGANSLLMVNGAEIIGNNAAITGVTNVIVADSSKLYIDGAVDNGIYNIIGDFETAGWNAENILSDNALIKFEDNKTDGKFDVIASLQSTDKVYGGAVVIGDVVDAAMQGKDSSTKNFFKAAVNINNNATTVAQVDALNASANIGELGGSSRNTYVASNLLTDAVAEHMSLANEKDHDQDIWAHYVHSKENVDGLALGGMTANYDTQYNGIVVGADLYKNGKGTIGTALTYIDGSTTGSSLASSTKNDATYYGMSIYGGVVNEDSAVIGDISYLHGKNDITQRNSGATLTAEPETDAFSIGVKAEKSFKAGNGKIVPYAGLRYMHLGTGNYANSISMNYDVDDANLFLLPIGVKYSTTHKTAGWTLRPIVEVGYVWTMGDRDIDQTVSLNGASNGFGFNIADSGAYIGRFAVEAEKANVTYGLGYEYQKGDSTKYNKWMANVNWKF